MGLVVGKITPLFPRTPFEVLPLALDDVPVHGLGTPSRIRLRLQDRAVGIIYPPRRTANHGPPIRPCGGISLSLIHISEPTRRTPISYAVFCLQKKKKNKHQQ